MTRLHILILINPSGPTFRLPMIPAVEGEATV